MCVCLLMFDECFQTENAKPGNSICKNKTKRTYFSRVKEVFLGWGGGGGGGERGKSLFEVEMVTSFSGCWQACKF